MPNTYFEVQSRGNVSYAYAPSTVTHNTLAEVATVDYVNSKISTGGSNPTGTIIAFAGSSIPAGFLLCNGAVISRTTYANLFKVIGTTWGDGDGSTTFKLPDARGRFPEGANGNLGTYHAAGLPNITGNTGIESGGTGSSKVPYTAAFYSTTEYYENSGISAARRNLQVLAISAQKSNALYGKATTIQPQSLCTQYLIKY